jgi:hypothetical protein
VTDHILASKPVKNGVNSFLNDHSYFHLISFSRGLSFYLTHIIRIIIKLSWKLKSIKIKNALSEKCSHLQLTSFLFLLYLIQISKDRWLFLSEHKSKFKFNIDNETTGLNILLEISHFFSKWTKEKLHVFLILQYLYINFHSVL